jgi:hypothetical protein
MRGIASQPRGIARLARALGLDSNLLRRASDRAEVCLRVGLVAICPPGGSGASLVKPTAAKAARFMIAAWYRCNTSTAVSGAAAFSSATVGSRFSANWSALHPPTTRTHWPAGVRSA